MRCTALQAFLLTPSLAALLAVVPPGCTNIQPEPTDDDDGEDDDTTGDDDTIGDDDTADDDTGDDDTGDDDTADDDTADDDTADDDTADDDTADDDTTPVGNVEDSCNTWDPVDFHGGLWEYDVTRNFPRVGDQSFTETVTSSGSSTYEGHTAEFLGATLNTVSYGTLYGTYWKACTGVGQFSYGFQTSYSGGGTGIAIDTVDNPGFKYLPPEVDLVAGANWTTAFNQSYLVNGTAALAIDVSASLSIASMAESVTVPAGTFNALHVHGTYSETETTTTGMIGSWTGAYDAWYARGVGMVKLRRTGDDGLGGGERTLVYGELVSYGGGLLPLP